MLKADVTPNTTPPKVVTITGGRKGDPGAPGPAAVLWGGLANDIDGVNRPIIDVGFIDFFAVEGATVEFAVPSDNTGPMTLRVSSAAGATAEADIRKEGGLPLDAGDFKAAGIYRVTFYGGTWQLMASSTAVPGDTGGSAGGPLWCGTAAGPDGQTIELTPVEPITAYVEGQAISFRVLYALDFPSAQVRVSGVNPGQELTKWNGKFVSPGDLVPGQIVEATYDGSGYRMMNAPAYSHSGALDVEQEGGVNVIHLDNATGDLVEVGNALDYTGPVEQMPLPTGDSRTVRFTAGITLQEGATLKLLNNGDNMDMQPGDFAVFRGYPGGVVRMSAYSPVAGQASAATALLSGATTPGDTDGALGDFFLDVASRALYGPKQTAVVGDPVYRWQIFNMSTGDDIGTPVETPGTTAQEVFDAMIAQGASALETLAGLSIAGGTNTYDPPNTYISDQGNTVFSSGAAVYTNGLKFNGISVPYNFVVYHIYTNSTRFAGVYLKEIADDDVPTWPLVGHLSA